MISIVVYGRNDHHGYNLHKRAAISLNCLAEVLQDPDDELIFVDYNSPDDTPTFPEAIADTLTRRARSVLRVLRVRPQLHRRFADRTNLPVLEAVARNVAVRRSNEANRWILSTNTDIILLPRQAASLSEVALGLASGFYHTARFEIPESLWESFDRRDPRQTMSDVRVLGRAARLNEVVYGSNTILYDGPGDFQLVERADLFAIDGFDERMLQAWHLDSNIAKRLTLRRGAVTSLLDQVYCYHCDHTRQATAAHNPHGPKNDDVRFVEQVTVPDLPEQRESWGCAGDEIEEIRLAGNSAGLYRSLIDSLVRPLPNEINTSFFTADTYGDYRYDPEHVLPFLADLLNCYPRNTRLAWCGLRRDMFSLVVQTWRQLGFAAPIAVHSAVATYLLAEADGGVDIVDQRQWLAGGDVYAFEFGRASDSGRDAGLDGGPLSGDDAEALALLHCLFLSAAEDERCRLLADPGESRRRFIGINCIHNRSELLFSAHIGMALTPFSTHLRHGLVSSGAHEFDAEAAMRAAIGRRLGRVGPIDKRKFALARELFEPLLGGGSILLEEHDRIATHAALGLAYLAARGDTGEQPAILPAVQRAIAAVEAIRPSATLGARLRLRLTDRPPAASERPLSRFAAFEDWDDPVWSAFAQRSAEDAGGSPYQRDGSRWEQAQMLYGLHRAGILTDTARVLVVAGMPDELIAAASRSTAAVEVYGLGGEAPGDAGPASRLFWANGDPYNPNALHVIASGTQINQLPEARYDAVLFPHGTMFGAGVEGALVWLQAAERLLRAGGIVAFKAEVAADALSDLSCFDIGMVGDDAFAAQLAALSAFVVEQGFDPLLSRQTVDKIWPESGPMPGERYFLSRQNGRVLVPSVWFLRKRDEAAPSQWNKIGEWIGKRLGGELLSPLLIGPAGSRDRDGAIIAVPGGAGHVFYGPYLWARAGLYRAIVRFEDLSDAGAPDTLQGVAEAVVDGEIIAQAAIDAGVLRTGTLVIDFEIPGRDADDGYPILEIRLFSAGGLAVRFRSVDLQQREISDIDGGSDPPSPGSFARAGSDINHRSDNVAPDCMSTETPVSSTLEVNNSVSSGIHPSPNSHAGIAAIRAAETAASAGGRPLSRVIALEDWQDRAWSAHLEPFSTGTEGGEHQPDPVVWERTQLLYGLAQSGRLTPQTRVVVVATMPDRAIGVLSDEVARLEVLDLLRGSDRRGAEARLYWSDDALYARDRLEVHDRSQWFGELPAGAYDVVVFPHGSLFCRGVAGIARLMEKAERLLAPGGLLVFKAEILTGSKPDVRHLDAGLVGGDGLVAQIERLTGFVVEGGFDARLSPATAGSVGGDGDGQPAPLLTVYGDRFGMPSLWFLTKRGQTPVGGWARLGRWLLDRLLGDQLGHLALGPAGRRDASGGIASGVGKGRVFYGPYLALPSGHYEVAVVMQASPGAPKGRVRIDVLAAGKVLGQQEINLGAGGSATVLLPFEVSRERADGFAEVEIRAWSSGGETTFTECRLTALPAS